MSAPPYAAMQYDRDVAIAREARRTAEALMLARQMEQGIDDALLGQVDLATLVDPGRGDRDEVVLL